MRRIESALERIAAACLMAVMLIVFADVGARYLLSMPFSWSYEFIGMYLMPTLFYFALSSTLAAGHHVAVDLLRPRMSRTVARLADGFDAEHGATVNDVVIEYARPLLKLALRGDGDLLLAKWAIVRKGNLFEEVCGAKILIKD